MSASSEGLKNIRSFKRKKLPDFQSIRYREKTWMQLWDQLGVNIGKHRIYNYDNISFYLNIRVV